jgi:cytosine/adenosine deaminase-related metal-dependent hydrolase
MMKAAEYQSRPGLVGSRRATPPVVLAGGWVALDPSTIVRADLEITDGHIARLVVQNGNGLRKAKSRSQRTEISVEGCLILPGLVNAHDHLEFNLFPRLGRGPYPNFERWANDIFHPECSPIREHLSIPKRVRLWWGGLKNLLSGVTTVCHHNPYEESVFDDGFPVHVVRRYGWAHSLRFGTSVREAFCSTPSSDPFIIHIGEGTDRRSENEIFALDRLGALDSRTVIVHGIGLTVRGHELRRQRGSALVWCPTSNRFTLGTTLDSDLLNECDRVALGSDSALTAEGNLLDEVRAANREGADPTRIYSMVTESGADVLRLGNDEGTLQLGGVADLIVVKWQDKTPAETLLQTRLETIEMVMVSGSPHLVSAGIARRFSQEFLNGFERITVEETPCLVRAPVCWLLGESRRLLGSDVCLAGKRVTV